MGIEPTSSAWKAEVLPLNYTRKKNRQAIMQQPTILVEGVGFEPTKSKQQIYSLPPLTAREPLPNVKKLFFHVKYDESRYTLKLYFLLNLTKSPNKIIKLRKDAVIK